MEDGLIVVLLTTYNPTTLVPLTFAPAAFRTRGLPGAALRGLLAPGAGRQAGGTKGPLLSRLHGGVEGVGAAHVA